jgi:hypothetical protein
VRVSRTGPLPPGVPEVPTASVGSVAWLYSALVDPLEGTATLYADLATFVDEPLARSAPSSRGHWPGFERKNGALLMQLRRLQG